MATFLAELDGKLLINERMKLSAFGLACICWGVDNLFVVDPGHALDGWQPHERSLCVTAFPSIAAAVEVHDGPVVLLEPRLPGIALPDYTHPRGALYVFGRDRGAGLRACVAGVRSRDVTVVYIPSPRDCYGFMAATIVAWDRYAKRALS